MMLFESLSKSKDRLEKGLFLCDRDNTNIIGYLDVNWEGDAMQLIDALHRVIVFLLVEI